MEQFSLEKWIENPSRRVVTRDRRPVRIVCWDAPTKNPIYGFVEGDDGITSWRKDGRFSNLIDNVDLFFANKEPETIEIPFGAKDSEFITDEYFIPEGYKARIEGNKIIIKRNQREDELTEFEKTIYQFICIIVNVCDSNVYDDKKLKSLVKEIAKELLNLAKKELEKGYYLCVKDNSLWEEGYKKGKEDALKSLPKLEKTKDAIDPTIPVMYTNAASMKSYVEYNGYKLCINDAFEKLPKEE